MSGRSSCATQSSTASWWSISASMLRSSCWWLSLIGLDARHADALQPAQHAQLGLRIAQPVEDHHADRVLDGRGEAGAPEDGTQAIKPQFVPQRVQRPDIAHRQGRLEAHLRHIDAARRAALDAQQAVEQRVQRTARLVQAAQGCDQALPRLAIFVAEGLDQANIAVTARGRDLQKHRPSVAQSGERHATRDRAVFDQPRPSRHPVGADNQKADHRHSTDPLVVERLPRGTIRINNLAV
jgi:hypothetical protein